MKKTLFLITTLLAFLFVISCDDDNSLSEQQSAEQINRSVCSKMFTCENLNGNAKTEFETEERCVTKMDEKSAECTSCMEKLECEGLENVEENCSSCDDETINMEKFFKEYAELFCKINHGECKDDPASKTSSDMLKKNEAECVTNFMETDISATCKFDADKAAKCMNCMESQVCSDFYHSTKCEVCYEAITCETIEPTHTKKELTKKAIKITCEKLFTCTETMKKLKLDYKTELECVDYMTESESENSYDKCTFNNEKAEKCIACIENSTCNEFERFDDNCKICDDVVECKDCGDTVECGDIEVNQKTKRHLTSSFKM